MKSKADLAAIVNAGAAVGIRQLLEGYGMGHLTERVLKVLDSAPQGSYNDHIQALVAERQQLVEEAGRILDRIMAIDEELREMESVMRRVLAVLDAAERERTRGGDSKAE